MKVIVGLGNPGSKYDQTRHNAGFDVIQLLEKHYNLKLILNKKFNSLIDKTKINNEDIIFVKPQTYMNLSGFAIASILNFYKIDISDLLVLVDDINIEFGKVRIREKGSPGGHNGLKNIENQISSNLYKRIRIGVGFNNDNDLIDHVLKKLSNDEMLLLNQGEYKAFNAVCDFINNVSFVDIMTKYNTNND